MERKRERERGRERERAERQIGNNEGSRVTGAEFSKTVVVVELRVLFSKAAAHLHVAVRNGMELSCVIVGTIASSVFFERVLMKIEL